MDLWDFFDRPWRERSRLCDVCDRECGSVVARDERGLEASAVRYSSEAASAGVDDVDEVPEPASRSYSKSAILIMYHSSSGLPPA